MVSSHSAILKKAPLLFIAAFVALSIAFFVPAGTLDYWQAWVYIAVLLIPASFVVAYFLKYDPEFLERRFQFKEKEARQRTILGIGNLFFLIGFLLPGFDKRLGWSNVPFEVVIAADVLVFLGYFFIILVFRENRYASRTVQVEKGQTVISTGPYSIIRHPMYLGVLFMYLATPIALGSYVALIPFLVIPIIIYFRILNEEEVLLRDLPGYGEYCEKTRYRLLPFIW